jgi:hypothetical protein
MKILSFDVGIRNLAYCILDIIDDPTPTIFISKWGVISLIPDNVKCKSLTVESAITILYSNLEEHFNDDTITHVIIENQPTKNQVMKTIQIAMYSYFNFQKLIMGRSLVCIKLINAINKLKICNRLFEPTNIRAPDDISSIPDKYRYKRTKKLGIFYTQHLLVNLNSHILVEDNINEMSKWIQLFSTSAKKDDLADSFLQALYYYDRELPKTKKLILNM